MPRPEKTTSIWPLLVILAGIWLGRAPHAAAPAGAFNHAHADWDGLLKQFTSNDQGMTWVDYRAIRQNSNQLKSYLQGLASVTRPTFDHWRRKQRLAFLINAYNAWTVQLIVEHYPLGSITEIGQPWKRPIVRLWGEDFSLDQLEHELIRRHFDEPRIHFALNCAARSCPPLRREAFTADRLDEQLEGSARQFLTDPRYNRVEAGSGKIVLYLSKLFEWYGQDFKSRYGGVLPFVAARIGADPSLQPRILEGAAEVRYLDYDWGLNGN